MDFVKAHGTGNDFVLLPDAEDTLTLTAPFVQALCDRRRGLGADGVIRLAPGHGDADVFMDYRNADGSVAEMCGNGVRCVVKYLVDRGQATADPVRVDTRAGIKPGWVVDRHSDGAVARVRVDMGSPRSSAEQQVEVDGRTMPITTVSMGNPHVVLIVDDVASVPLADWAASLGGQDGAGANVEVVQVKSPHHLAGRIFERGVGETMASGTGVSAMAVAAHLQDMTDRDVIVDVPGGQLEVSWTDEGLFVTGPAEEVAAGRLDAHWLAMAGLRQLEQPV